MRLADIRVPKSFEKTQPSCSKLIACANYYSKFGTLDKPITVSGNGILIDGYVRYLVAKKMGLEEVPVIERAELRVYVQAQHTTNGKKYWWKVKKKDEQKFMDAVHKGDHILVNTKKGLCTVTIDDIKLSNKAPIDKRIKTVVKF